MFDDSNIGMWKFKISSYLKALGLHVYLAAIKKSYVDNGKYLEANAQTMDALKHTLCKKYIFLVSHCGFIFVVWNTLISHKKQASNISERESIGNESNQACYIVQENDSLEVTLDSHLDVRHLCH